ncbi:MAG: hypothetical protein JXR76_16510 [Deltaproteobacteria bacterium]|nr:hypothetical protein [Deltaproteobacteria bacterium]
MPTRHFVESSSFEFKFESEETAFNEQQNIASLVKNTLLPIMAEVFDDISLRQSMIRLSALDIDMGAVSKDNYQAELPDRFRKALVEALSKRSGRQPYKNATPGRMHEVNTATDADTLIYFLGRGVLPWYATGNSKDYIETLLPRVLKTQPERLATALHRDETGTMLARLISQFSDNALNRFVAQYETNSAHLCIANILETTKPEQALQPTHGKSHKFSSFPATPMASTRDRRQWWKQRISRALSPENYQDANGLDTIARERFGIALSRSIISGRLSIESALWKRLAGDRSEILFSALMHHGQRADVRHRLAFGFPETALKDIVFVLEPAEYPFIDEVIASPQMIGKTVPKEPVAQSRRRLFEYTFGYLMVDRGSRFNKKMYLDSVLRQMAARENTGVPELLFSFQAILSELQEQTSAVTEIRQLLAEMAQKITGKTNDTKGRMSSPHYLSTAAKLSDMARFDAQMGFSPNTPGSNIAHQTKEALINGKIKTLFPFWDALTYQYRDLFRGAIVKHGRHPQTISAMAKDLTSTMFGDVIVVIEPTQGKLVGRSCQWLCEKQISGLSKTMTQKKAERGLRTIVLTVLLDETVIGFNLHSFIARLVRQIAAHDNTSSRKMIHAMLAEMGEHAQKDPLLEKMHAVLKDLAGANILEGSVLSVEPAGTSGAPAKSTPPLYSKGEMEVSSFKKGVGGILPSDSSFPGNGKSAAVLPPEKGHNQSVNGNTLTELSGLSAHGSQNTLSPLHVPSTEAQTNSKHVLAESINLSDAPGLHGTAPNTLRLISDEDLKRCMRNLISLSQHDKEKFHRFLLLTGNQISRTQRNILTTEIQRMGAKYFTANMSGAASQQLLLTLVPHEAKRATTFVDRLLQVVSSALPVLSRQVTAQIALQMLYRFLIVEGRRFEEKSFLMRLIEALQKKVPIGSLPDCRKQIVTQLFPNADPDDFTATDDFKLLKKQQAFSGRSSQNTDTAPLSPVSTSPTHQKPSEFNYDSTPYGTHSHKEAETLFVDNAGLVLVAPFFSQLFSRLNYLKNGLFKSPDSQQRAVHLTQFVVNQRVDVPEYMLTLNKRLCGLPDCETVPACVDISNVEEDTVTAMLAGIIQHWQIIRNTSVQGFRESFLQREGRLSISEKEIRLWVAPAAFDMLLDQLPWSIGIIKLPWMERAIHVEWR